MRTRARGARRAGSWVEKDELGLPSLAPVPHNARAPAQRWRDGAVARVENDGGGGRGAGSSEQQRPPKRRREREQTAVPDSSSPWEDIHHWMCAELQVCPPIALPTLAAPRTPHPPPTRATWRLRRTTTRGSSSRSWRTFPAKVQTKLPRPTAARIRGLRPSRSRLRPSTRRALPLVPALSRSFAPSGVARIRRLVPPAPAEVRPLLPPLMGARRRYARSAPRVRLWRSRCGETHSRAGAV